MSEQMVAPDRSSGSVERDSGAVARRMLAFWRWVQMHNLPAPYTVTSTPLKVLITTGLRDFEWWLEKLGDPSVFVSVMKYDPRPTLFVDAVADLDEPIGRVEVTANFEALHLEVFPRRLASLPEVYGLLAPPPAPLGAEPAAEAAAVSR
ncbi:MAG: hypothetical protein ACREXX_13990 [Gammaproteobacteria bacterium]